jgi:hypothetical protein
MKISSLARIDLAMNIFNLGEGTFKSSRKIVRPS